MVIVDTSVWIHFLNGKLTPETEWLLGAQHIEPIGLTSLTLAEVMQGIGHENRFRAAQKYFEVMPIFHTMSSSLAIQSARNYRALRALGLTSSTVDCMVATFCIEEDHRLLHCDADFKPFEQELGLKVVRP